MSVLSVDFLTSFCIEIEPSEQVRVVVEVAGHVLAGRLAGGRRHGRAEDHGAAADGRDRREGDLALAETERH